jgi:hypothetical protein
VLSRLLLPEENLLTLSNIPVAEITTKISTPVPNEKPNSVDPRVVSQAKALVPSYHTKMQRLITNAAQEASASRSKRPTAGIRVLASTVHDARDAALRALNGRGANAKETGLVTRIDMNGDEMPAGRR